MVADFAAARSGLRRLHEAGLEIQASAEYRLLASLLDYEGRLADLTVQIRVAADGRIRNLHVEKVEENSANPFHRAPLSRWLARLRLRWRGFHARPPRDGQPGDRAGLPGDRPRPAAPSSR